MIETDSSLTRPVSARIWSTCSRFQRQKSSQSKRDGDLGGIPGSHGPGPVCVPGLDGLDPRFPVWVGAAAVRGDGGPQGLESRTRRHAGNDGPRITHVGVHDHGFNVISTYGLLYQLGRSGRIPGGAGELDMYALALKVSGAVQAMRWTSLHGDLGYIYSFNGPHSLLRTRCAP